MQISSQQVCFFETFGYLKLPQAFAGDLGWIISEFEQVFVDRGIVPDGKKRTTIVPFIDQREKLAALLDHPVILGAAKALLGEEFNYLAGDGSYYFGDTNWHPDGDHQVGKYIKMAFYLDPVRRANGALQVFPRSHGIGKRWEGAWPGGAAEIWGIPPSELPSITLDSDPGDLLIFNHNIMHASFGGSGFRRMFTLNLGAHAETPEEITELENYLKFHCGPRTEDKFTLKVGSEGGHRVHSAIMRDTAGPERMKHLQQVLDLEYVFAPEPVGATA